MRFAELAELAAHAVTAITGAIQGDPPVAGAVALALTVEWAVPVRHG